MCSELFLAFSGSFLDQSCSCYSDDEGDQVAVNRGPGGKERIDL
jgi:hypothetical protein